MLCREVVSADGAPHLRGRLSVHRDNGELAEVNVSATKVIGRVGVKLIILPLRYLNRGHILAHAKQIRDSSAVVPILLL